MCYISLDLDKKVLTFTMHLPKLVQKAKYEVDGKIMVMPIFGKGDSVISLCEYLNNMFSEFLFIIFILPLSSTNFSSESSNTQYTIRKKVPLPSWDIW